MKTMSGIPDRRRWRPCVMSLLGASPRNNFMLPLPAQPGDPSSRIGVFLGTAAVLHVRLSAVLGMGLDSR